MTKIPEPSDLPQHIEDAYLHAPVGRASVAPDGTVVRANYRFADLFGRRFVDLDGAAFTDLAPTLAATLGETTTETEVVTERRGGDGRALVTVAPMRTADGQVVGYDVYATDITELRVAEAELRRTEQEFRALVAHSSDVITVLESDGTWRSSSAAGSRLLGWPEGYDPPGGVFSVLHPDDVELAQRAFEEVLAGTRTPDDPIVLRARSADGTRYLYFETVARNLLHDPAVRGIVATSRDVTERIEAQEAASASEERFSALVQHSRDLVVVLDRDGSVRYVSPASERIFGRRPQDVQGVVGTDLVHPDDVDAAINLLAEVASRPGRVEEIRVRVAHVDGSFRTVEAIGQNRLDDPAVGGIVLNVRDVTEREAAERQAARLLEVLERSIEVVVLSDASGRVIWANDRAREILGLGKDPHVSELSTIESREKLRDVVMPFVRRHGVWTGELSLRTTSGDELPVIATVQGHREQGDIVLVSTIAHDITELKAAQNRLQHEATHDALTGLPNRSLLYEVGEQALGRAARRGSTIAVLFLDLDHFKEVNDTLGHDAGDRVLVELARRLRVGVRTGDLVARLGGDEFCVLCESVENQDEVRDLGQRIRDVVSIPISVHGREVQIGTSIGIALDVSGRSSMGALLRNADVALYRAKRSGAAGSKVTMFDEASMGAGDAEQLTERGSTGDPIG